MWAFVMTAVYRTDSDAYRIRSCNTLFLLYLDVEEPSEKKKERKTHKVREVTEGLLLWLSVCCNLYILKGNGLYFLLHIRDSIMKGVFH